MRAGVTELRNTRNATRKRHLANAAQTTSGGRGRRHLANAYETLFGQWVITARVTRRGAASAEGASRTPSRGRVITASVIITKVEFDTAIPYRFITIAAKKLCDLMTYDL